MPNTFRNLSEREQEQIFQAYPDMKGWEHSFWCYYPTLEKRFWGGIVIICVGLFVLFIVSFLG